MASALAAILLSACADGAITPPDASEARRSGNAAVDLDVTGSWSWNDDEILSMPPWAVSIVFPGIDPEGAVTRFRCSSAGTMTLAEGGGALTGLMTRSSLHCTTSGGQQYHGGPTSGSPLVARVVGSHLRIERLGMVSCTYQLRIATGSEGTATALTGGATCIVPGHPQSPIPIDPPPGGIDKILSFTATR